MPKKIQLECPEGKVRNPETGRCVKDKSQSKKCPEGTVLNPETGRCNKVKVKAKPEVQAKPVLELKAKPVLELKAKDCPEGKVRNPETGRCVKAKEDKKPKECPEGKVLNPETGRCVKVKTQKPVLALKPGAESILAKVAKKHGQKKEQEMLSAMTPAEQSLHMQVKKLTKKDGKIDYPKAVPIAIHAILSGTKETAFYHRGTDATLTLTLLSKTKKAELQVDINDLVRVYSVILIYEDYKADIEETMFDRDDTLLSEIEESPVLAKFLKWLKGADFDDVEIRIKDKEFDLTKPAHQRRFAKALKLLGITKYAKKERKSKAASSS